MEVSLGIITYKDTDNLELLFESISNQRSGGVSIKEIIVVIVGSELKDIKKICSDKLSKFNVKIIPQDKRKGKYSAINLFLKSARSKYLIISSGDITLEKDAIYTLCQPFKDKSVGIVTSRPIPKRFKQSKFLFQATKLIWELKHHISLKRPKFGEFIACRKVDIMLEKTSVDEEALYQKYLKRGFIGVYESRSIIYNTGPRSIRDFINQRRRIFCGHLQLRKKTKYAVPSLSPTSILDSQSIKIIFSQNIFYVFLSIFLELVSRMLGFFDYLTGADYTMWKIIER